MHTMSYTIYHYNSDGCKGMGRLSRYDDFHYKDKTVMRPSYLYHGNPYAGTLQWRHNGRDSVSNHQPHDCLLNGLFRRRSKETWKLRVTGLCVGNSPGTGEFPAQMASNCPYIVMWLTLRIVFVAEDLVSTWHRALIDEHINQPSDTKWSASYGHHFQIQYLKNIIFWFEFHFF